MSDPSTRAERIQRLKHVLDEHGLREDEGSGPEHLGITPLGDGMADVTELGEAGVRAYAIPWPLDDGDETQQAASDDR